MKLTEIKPRHPEIASFVDRYQFFEIESPSYLKTIPNGKWDVFAIIKGGFDLLRFQEEQFVAVPATGILTATKYPSLLRISDHLVCLNIKMNLNLLGLDAFKNYYQQNVSNLSSVIYTPEVLDVVMNLKFVNKTSIHVDTLDQALLPFFEETGHDPLLDGLLSSMYEMDEFKVGLLAESMNVSPKTLARITLKHFQLNPNELWNILRFEQATSHLKKSKTQKLIEALAFGYYDQSHFIRECKKITGTTPKDFFAHLDLPTNDLMVYKDIWS